MDAFYFTEFGKLKYLCHTIYTYSGFQWATALSSESADSVITYLLEVIPRQDSQCSMLQHMSLVK